MTVKSAFIRHVLIVAKLSSDDNSTVPKGISAVVGHLETASRSKSVSISNNVFIFSGLFGSDVLVSYNITVYKYVYTKYLTK